MLTNLERAIVRFLSDKEAKPPASTSRVRMYLTCFGYLGVGGQTTIGGLRKLESLMVVQKIRGKWAMAPGWELRLFGLEVRALKT